MIQMGVGPDEAVQIRRRLRGNMFRIIAMEKVSVDRLQDNQDHAVIRRIPAHDERLPAQQAQPVQQTLVLVGQGLGLAGRFQLVLFFFKNGLADKIRHYGCHEQVAELAAALFHLLLRPEARPVEGEQAQLAPRQVKQVEPDRIPQYHEQRPGRIRFVAPRPGQPEGQAEKRHKGRDGRDIRPGKGGKNALDGINIEIPEKTPCTCMEVCQNKGYPSA